MTPAHRFPRRRRVVGPFSFLDSPTPLAFAHRGGAAVGDENTATAFARAVDTGFRYLETDVHATRDGVAVLFHDDDLSRLADDPRQVEDLRWSDLRSIRVDGQAAIPRLDETLEQWPQVRFNLDVKTDASVSPTLDVVAAVGARDRVLIASFSDRRLARVRANSGPRLATSMGTGEIARLWAASRVGAGLVGFVPRAAAAQVPLRRGPLRVVDRAFVSHAHRIGIQVHVWTIDDPDRMEQLLDLGVDGIMTDRIDILANVYRNRGHWPD